MIRIGDNASEIVQLFLHQQSRGSLGDVFRYADRRSMRAMCGAKSVVYIESVAQPGELLGKPVVVSLFFFVKSKVFEQQHVAILHYCGLVFCLIADAVCSKNNRPTKQTRKVFSHRGKAVPLNALTLRPAQVRSKNHASIMCNSIADRRQSRANARVVFNLSFLERYVEIDANEDAIALQVKVFDGKLRH
jgi:hypothetical protein